MPHFNINGKSPILFALTLLGLGATGMAIHEDYSFSMTIKPTSIIIVGQPGNLRLPPTRDR